MPTGDAMQHIGGGDRGPLPCVTYGDPGRRKQVSIDWTKTRAHATPDVAPVAVPATACAVCSSTTDVSTYTGLCDLCAAGADPHRTTTPLVAVPDLPEPPMPEPTPDRPPYVDLFVDLLVETEHHPDPVVKATRKIMAQAAVALRAAVRAAGPAPTPTAPYAGRLQALGVTAAEVRGWARAANVKCPASGRLPAAVIDAYEAAHQTGATS